jgi:hypothetical protein
VTVSDVIARALGLPDDPDSDEDSPFARSKFDLSADAEDFEVEPGESRSADDASTSGPPEADP